MEECTQCGERGSPDTIRLCSSCKTVGYCSRDCQKQHWSQHKTLCRKARDKALHVHDKDWNQQPASEGGAKAGGERGTGEGAAGGEVTTVGEAAGEGRADVPEDGSGGDEPMTTCHKCGIQRDSMKICGSCRKVKYCSRDCQRADWKRHKTTCQPTEKVNTEVNSKTKQKEPAKNGKNKGATEPMKKGKNKGGATKDSQRDQLCSSLSRVHVTSPLGWEEARSRAESRYPRHRIVDKFRDLRNDWMGVVRKEAVVAVVKIGPLYPHFFRHGRCLEDAEGQTSFVLFHTDDPKPYFTYEQLREGNFLCYQHAYMHFFLDGNVGFRVDEAREVHILEPTKQSSQKPATAGKPPASTSTEPATSQQWQEAKLKAQAVFPDVRVLDSLQDIDQNDLRTYTSLLPVIPSVWNSNENFFYQKGEIKAALLVQLESPLSYSSCHGWVVKDKKGKDSQLNFEFSGLPRPFFCFEHLRKGIFMCVSQPWVFIDMGCYAVCVNDASSVRIIRV